MEDGLVGGGSGQRDGRISRPKESRTEMAFLGPAWKSRPLMAWGSQEEEDKDLVLLQSLSYSLLGFRRVRGEEGVGVLQPTLPGLSPSPDGAEKWEETDGAGEEEEDSGREEEGAGHRPPE